MIRTRFLWLLALLLGLCALASTKAIATPRSVPKKTYEQQRAQLLKAIQEADKLGQPQTLRTHAESLRSLAQKHHTFWDLLWATDRVAHATSSITPDEYDEIYIALENMRLQPWLSAQERMALAAYTFEHYAESYERYTWQSAQNPRLQATDSKTDSLRPSYWSQEQYLQRLNTLARRALAEPRVLGRALPSKTMAPWHETPPLWQGSWSSWILPRLANAQVLKADTPLRSYILGHIDRYAQSLPISSDRMHAHWLGLEIQRQLDLWSQSEQETAYRGFVQHYTDLPPLLHYLPNALKKAYDLEEQLPEIIKSLDLHLAKLKASKQLAMSVRQERIKLLEPALYYHVAAAYVVGGDRKQRLIIKHRLLEGYTIRLYRVDHATKIREHTTTKSLKLLRETTHQTGGAALAAMRTDTIVLEHQSPGYYYVQVLPQIAQIARDASWEALKFSHRYCRYHVTDKYVLRHRPNRGEVPMLQWFDAKTGRPLAAEHLRLYAHQREHLVSADQHGLVTLDPISKRASYYHVRSQDERDPLGVIAEAYRDREYADREHYLRVVCHTDRVLYRPGEQVHSYGYVFEIGRHVEQAKVLPKHSVKFTVTDPDGEEVYKAEFTTDDYGRFAHTFIPKAEGKRGRYTLAYRYGDKRDVHYRSISIEDYKAPSYRIEIERPKVLLRLGDMLRLPIRLYDLSGAPLSGGRIRAQAKIVRHSSARYHSRADMSKSLELPELETDAQGLATLALTLQELPVPKGRQATDSDYQTYTINLEITSPTGEVQQQQVEISVGVRPPTRLLVVSPAYAAQGQTEVPAMVRLEGLYQQGYQAMVHYRLYQGSKLLGQGQCLSDQEHNLSSLIAQLPRGHYELRYEVELYEGKTLTATEPLTVYHEGDRSLEAGDLPLLVLAPRRTYSSAQPPTIYVTSGLEDSYVFYHTSVDGKTLGRGLVRPHRGEIVRLPIDLPRGKQTELIEVQVYTVREGRLHTQTIELTRTQPNKELSLHWLSLRKRTLAGSQETWQLEIRQGDQPVQAALAAWMYDSALDEIKPNAVDRYRVRPLRFARRYRLVRSMPTGLELNDSELDGYQTHVIIAHSPQHGQELEETYLDWGEDFSNGLLSSSSSLAEEVVVGMASSGRVPKTAYTGSSSRLRSMAMDTAEYDSEPLDDDNPTTTEASEPLPRVRSQFAGTAFFLPLMQTDPLGRITWQARLPETLTRWRLEALAHTPDLKTGHISAYVEGYRELMVKPYLPRFARMGDSLQVSTQLISLAETELSGEVTLELYHPGDAKLLLRHSQPFVLPRSAREVYAFRVESLPQLDSIGVRIMASSGTHTDGEEHVLPLLPETEETVRGHAFTILDARPSTISLDALFPTNGFIPETGRLELRIESNPLLLALEALPPLAQSEFTGSSIDLATSWYAHCFARSIAAHPGLGAWVEARLAQLSETKADERQRLEALRHLIATSRDTEHERRLLAQLAQRQREDGFWSWYPGMSRSELATMYIMRLLLRQRYYLPKEGLVRSMELMLDKGWQALDQMALNQMAEQQSTRQHGSSPLPWFALDYLYLQALGRRSISGHLPQVQQYLVDRLRERAHQLPLYSKAKAAFALAEIDRPMALQLIESLRQHLSKGEVGAFFDQVRSGGYWWTNRSYSFTTEMIEALDRLQPDWGETQAALQGWLLNQKRSVRWESGVATSEALHALFLGSGKEMLESANRTKISLERADETQVELSGERLEYTETFVKSSAPRRLVAKAEQAGQVWGSATASYTLPMQLQTASGRELRAERRYFIKTKHEGQVRLVPIEEVQALKVGDILVTQLYIRLERDMDFVRLRDPRLGCTEPTEQLSHYQWGAGTSYYYEPRDTETNFYFDRLDRGEYRLEYEQHLVRAGRYQIPSAQLQSMYAPEYTATTGFGGSIRIER